jgi:hypothetical protein
VGVQCQIIKYPDFNIGYLDREPNKNCFQKFF